MSKPGTTPSTLSSMMNDDDLDLNCPLCMEEWDIADLRFQACSCGYQVCLWCWHHIKNDLNDRCPGCRQQYSKEVVTKTPDPRLLKYLQDKQKKEKSGKKESTQNRKVLQDVRVVQRNLVYVIGIPLAIAKEEILRRDDLFGRFGKIVKIVVNRNSASRNFSAQDDGSAGCYVTYAKAEDAAEAISYFDTLSIDGRILRASYGTSKYCSFFLKHQPCTNPECMYLHEIGLDEDSFTKEDMTSIGTKSKAFHEMTHGSGASKSLAVGVTSTRSLSLSSIIGPNKLVLPPKPEAISKPKAAPAAPWKTPPPVTASLSAQSVISPDELPPLQASVGLNSDAAQMKDAGEGASTKLNPWANRSQKILTAPSKSPSLPPQSLGGIVENSVPARSTTPQGDTKSDLNPAHQQTRQSEPDVASPNEISAVKSKSEGKEKKLTASSPRDASTSSDSPPIPQPDSSQQPEDTPLEQTSDMQMTEKPNTKDSNAESTQDTAAASVSRSQPDFVPPRKMSTPTPIQPPLKLESPLLKPTPSQAESATGSNDQATTLSYSLSQSSESRKQESPTNGQATLAPRRFPFPTAFTLSSGDVAGMTSTPVHSDDAHTSRQPVLENRWQVPDYQVHPSAQSFGFNSTVQVYGFFNQTLSAGTESRRTGPASEQQQSLPPNQERSSLLWGNNPLWITPYPSTATLLWNQSALPPSIHAAALSIHTRPPYQGLNQADMGALNPLANRPDYSLLSSQHARSAAQPLNATPATSFAGASVPTGVDAVHHGLKAMLPNVHIIVGSSNSQIQESSLLASALPTYQPNSQVATGSEYLAYPYGDEKKMPQVNTRPTPNASWMADPTRRDGTIDLELIKQMTGRDIGFQTDQIPHNWVPHHPTQAPYQRSLS
eukprot:TRINITY_DN10456_c0_g1_i2.p1 TRINITY_DN10456_c0_g1~~TRINITY_DN10456_c0_g1_i2.p1  ORF type:complete len:887 (+),score=152.11 TRINITY_DN10456_c0_g1_i2:141-2801(+)